MSDFLTKGRRKDEEFGETALTYLKELALKEVLGIEKKISSKYLDKGILMEDKVIELYNRVHFKSYKKNEKRITKYGISGCCDIDSEKENKILDAKSSWSKNTFPFFAENVEKEIKKGGYEDQIRGYMMIYDRDFGEIFFGLVDTPPELIGYENIEDHEVEHLPESIRISRSKIIERNKEWEDKFLERHEKAEKIFNNYCNEIAIKLK